MILGGEAFLELPRDSVAPGRLESLGQDKVSIRQMSALCNGHLMSALYERRLRVMEGAVFACAGGRAGLGGWPAGPHRALLFRRDECWVGQPGIYLPQPGLSKLN